MMLLCSKTRSDGGSTCCRATTHCRRTGFAPVADLGNVDVCLWGMSALRADHSMRMTSFRTWFQRKLDEPCGCHSGRAYRSCCSRRETAYFAIATLTALALLWGTMLASPSFQSQLSRPLRVGSSVGISDEPQKDPDGENASKMRSSCRVSRFDSGEQSGLISA
jgi:hypothetical protein